jgi:ATP-dependent DNA helicase RecG
VPRNHTVIDALRRYGLAEDSGQGIDVIQDTMRLELLDEPSFVEAADAFLVELPIGGLVSTTERGWLAEFERTGLVGNEERILLLTLLRDGRVNNARARDVLEVDSTDARARLRRLRDAGLVRQHGTRGRAYYTIGSIGPTRGDEQVVIDAAAAGPVSNSQVRDITGLDRDAARALLRRLVSEGRLVQQGERRGTTYTVPER